MASDFSRFEEFARLARHDGIDARPALLRVLTDFYVQKSAHTDEEEQHFITLALRLIDEVDEPTRALVAQKLTDYGAAPAAVLARLGVARPAEPQAPARTLALPPAPTSPPAPAQAAPAPVSSADRAAAARFSDMFFKAGSDERRAILRELETTASAPPLPIPQEDAAAAIQRMEAAALRGRPFEFALEVERVLAVPRHYAEAILRDASGEPMLVMAKAIGMPIDAVQRILLLVNPLIGSSVRRVFDLCALYEDISQQAALRLVLLWRHAGVAQGPTHQPVQPQREVIDPREAPQAARPSARPAAAPRGAHQRDRA